MKINLYTALTLVATITTTVALVGCGNDAPVRQDGEEGGGGSAGTSTGGTSGTGGNHNNPPEGSCYDADGKPCTGAGTTGNSWAIASGDLHQSDDYNKWLWVSAQNDEFANCFNSASCKAKIVANDPTVKWQYLGDGDYKEAYNGNLGMFNLGRSASTCGYNLQIQSATKGLCWGEVKLSTGGRETFKTQRAVIGFESGDKCAPGAVIALCENAITVSQYTSGSTPPNPSPQSFDGAGDGMGMFFSRVWADEKTIARATKFEDMFTFKTTPVFNSRNKIQAPKAEVKLPEGRTAREVIIGNDGVRFIWLDGSEDFKPSAIIKNQGFGPSDG